MSACKCFEKTVEESGFENVSCLLIDTRDAARFLGGSRTEVPSDIRETLSKVVAFAQMVAIRQRTRECICQVELPLPDGGAENEK